MTDYQSTDRVRNSTWKKLSDKNKWRSIIAIFIVVVLVFAILSGFLKSLTLSKKLALGGWDGISSFVVGVRGEASGLFIFQKDPKRALFVKFGNVLGNMDSSDYLPQMSVGSEVNVEKFISLGDKNGGDAEKTFANFTSFFTPIKILTGGWDDNDTHTNISRIEALRLWWQAKDVRSSDLKIMDLSALAGSSAKDKKVLGATSEEINREIAPFLENVKILKEDAEIKIVNSSSDLRSAALASKFISSVGGRVSAVSGDTREINKCRIDTNAKNSYTVKYLAKVFGCDINDTGNDDKETMTIYLGLDFSNRYFE